VGKRGKRMRIDSVKREQDEDTGAPSKGIPTRSIHYMLEEKEGPYFSLQTIERHGADRTRDKRKRVAELGPLKTIRIDTAKLPKKKGRKGLPYGGFEILGPIQSRERTREKNRRAFEPGALLRHGQEEENEGERPKKPPPALSQMEGKKEDKI